MQSKAAAVYLWLCIALVLLSGCQNKVWENRVSARFHAEEIKGNAKPVLWQRQVFPYSVAPGGTYDAEEAGRRAAADPVVGEHYKGIQLTSLKPFRLTRPAQGYVSYRVGNRIYWTKRMVRFQPGELLLSDGQNLIRGRCGNRISLEPEEPVLRREEPKHAVFEEPVMDVPTMEVLAGMAEFPAVEKQANLALPSRFEMVQNPVEELLRVAPDVVSKTSLIGGSFPGGVMPTKETGEIVLETGYWWPVGWGMKVLEVPGFVVPGWKPIFTEPYTLPGLGWLDRPIGVLPGEAFVRLVEIVGMPWATVPPGAWRLETPPPLWAGDPVSMFESATMYLEPTVISELPALEEEIVEVEDGVTREGPMPGPTPIRPTNEPPPAAPIPEAGTGWMLVTGAALIGLRSWLNRRL
jgi:hypothetical protein